ncbi:MAG: hypothetical protein K2O91_11785 [Lachnospiraceae bacterium]|nr:hypothetical protein [Lachnospiraceae bacterium]
MSVTEEFFFIHSKNLENVNSRLYGFCIDTAGRDMDGILNDADAHTKTYNGCFVLVQDKEKYIYISQDFIGCYGLYLFRKDDYFAISNSFHYLLDHIRQTFPLTVNMDYMKCFILYRLSPSCSETMINEVEMLPRNVSVIIDKESKTLSIYKKIMEDEIVELDSDKGMEALDNWYYSWTNFIRNLCAKTDKVTVDLSGGMDSRLTFLLFLCSGVDLNKIRVNSTDDGLAVHAEDFEIAQAVAKRYKFELNKTFPIEYIAFSLRDTIELSFYTKLGFHKEMYFKRSYCGDTVYAFSGGGGEAIRGYHTYSKKKFFEDCLSMQSALGLDIDFMDGVKNVVDHGEDLVNDIRGCVNEREFGRHFYKQGTMRNHFGKSMVEQYLANRMRIAPLMDMNLHKIRLSAEDADLLMALIYIRYCPELLDFKFDRGHSIDEKSVKAAERINKKYPFMESLEKQKYFSDIDIYFEYKPFAEPAVKDGTNQPDEWCRKVFHSEYIKQNICRLVSGGFYEHAGKFAKTHSYQSLRAICVAIAIAKVDYDVVSGQNIGNTSIYDFLEKMAEGNYYE